ncbi:MAG: type III secretion system export apparatus subunit SctV [Deltaproteobacteria bacterium]|nr:type III secretion system export apparatus subunit SctV [Deltaproteobacteria bacterium]
MSTKTDSKLLDHSDLVLAALVVGVVVMMIIPLPTFVLDLLITANISLGVVLLLVSIYINNAVRIATFPSILLITTLFRLGLNVSSTRLILLQADAGDVIAAFGGFVVAGNLVVGSVIFLILTLIQFLVIAKGSERVAEVAARFTLDAMPGKQMAIDADVRAGAIEMADARRQRGTLQRESQLYGSMDGAMKFVKGDAIAGILITVINIIGGLLIGVLQRGMDVGGAARLYTQLTIGDGLVSQIPALLVSTAAGIIVTRVASEDEGAHLGRDIGEQILAQPRALALSAGLLVLFAIVPGMPTIPFLVLAALLGFVSWGRRASRVRPTRRRIALGGVKERHDGVAGDEVDEELPAPAQLTVELGEDLAAKVGAEVEGNALTTELIPGLREMLYMELGVLLPGVQVRAHGVGLAPSGYRLLLTDVPVAEGRWELEGAVALVDASELRARGIEALPITVPGVASPAARVSAEHEVSLRDEGFQLLDAATALVLHLGDVVRLHVAELIGIQETQQLLDALERTHPALVAEVVPKLVNVQTLAEVLRRLVEEGLPVRQLRGILESLAELAGAERDPVALTEQARRGLRRYISYKYADDEGQLQALLLDPAIEQMVRESVQHTDKGSYLAIEPQLAQEIVSAVSTTLQEHTHAIPSAVVLTHADVRRYFRRLIEGEHPGLAVLSFDELLPQVQVQLLARVAP